MPKTNIIMTGAYEPPKASATHKLLVMKVGCGYIIHYKKDILFLAEKLPKRLSLFSNIFYHHTWVYNFNISFLEDEKSKLNIRSHRLQYSKILKSPTNNTIFYLMMSFWIKLIVKFYYHDSIVVLKVSQ